MRKRRERKNAVIEAGRRKRRGKARGKMGTRDPDLCTGEGMGIGHYVTKTQS